MKVETQSCERLNYWAANGTNDDGVEIVSAPVVITGRFLKGKKEFLGAMSGAFTCDATLTDITENIAIHSLVQPYENNATNFEIYEVVETKSVPDIKGRNIRRTCFLNRYKNSTPPQT